MWTGAYISQTVSFWKNGIFHDLDFHSNWHEFMMIRNSIQNQSSLIWDFIQSTPLSPGKWNVVVSPIPFICEFEFNSSSTQFDLRFHSINPLRPQESKMIITLIPYACECEFNSNSTWYDPRILFILIWTWMKIKKSRIIPYFQYDTVWPICRFHRRRTD